MNVSVHIWYNLLYFHSQKVQGKQSHLYFNQEPISAPSFNSKTHTQENSPL